MFGCGFGNGFVGGWSSWMIIPMLLKFAVWGGIIYFGIKLFKSNSSNNTSAMKILNEKYAMGEIGEEEYFKRKNSLGK